MLSELWILCAPLTWQEQESFRRKVHLAALPGPLLLRLYWLEVWSLLIIFSLVLQFSVRVHRTH